MFIYILHKKNVHTSCVSGFECCIQYGSNECSCSYSCKFVREYYEDSKELSEAQRKLLNSSWAAKRKISAEEREKRKAAEAAAQAEMWKRVQEEMAKEEENIRPEEEVAKEAEDMETDENKKIEE